MKNLIMKVWNDPVGSKVIAALIIAALGVVYSFINSWVSDTESFWDTLQKVFGYQVNIWLALVFILGVWAISSYRRRKSSVANERKKPPFVQEFVKGEYQGHIWKWRWKWNAAHKIYYIVDLNIECPICHKGLLTLEYMNYRCAKCNAEIPYEMMNTTDDAVKKQILEEARHKYNNYADSIGSLPISIMKA